MTLHFVEVSISKMPFFRKLLTGRSGKKDGQSSSNKLVKQSQNVPGYQQEPSQSSYPVSEEMQRMMINRMKSLSGCSRIPSPLNSLRHRAMVNISHLSSIQLAS